MSLKKLWESTKKEMTEEDKKARIATLNKLLANMVVIHESIKTAQAMEEVAAQRLQDIVSLAMPDTIADHDDRMYLVGTASALLLESVKQRGSIKKLADEFSYKIARIESDIDEMEHPEKYDMMCKAEAGKDSAAPTVEND